MSQFTQESNDEDNQPKQESFASGWDPMNKHIYEQPTPDMAKASQVILSVLKPRRTQETMDWLTNLSQEVLSRGTGTQVDATVSRPTANQTERWVDTLFDELKRLASSFNRTATGTDLISTVIRPDFAALANASKSMQDGGILYHGHVATRFWVLLLRGFPDGIEVFVVPAQNLLSLSSSSQLGREDFLPFMTIQAPWGNDAAGWTINGTNFTVDMLAPLARELFGDLIRVASGKMSESELHTQTDPKLGETVAIGYEATSDTTPARNSGDMSLSETNVLFALSTLIRVIDSELSELHDVLARTLSGTDADAQTRVTNLENLRQSVMQAMKQWQASLPKSAEF